MKGGESDNGEGSVLMRALSFKKDGDTITINVNIYWTPSAHAFDRGAKDQLPHARPGMAAEVEVGH
jgi:hypothetical protein